MTVEQGPQQLVWERTDKNALLLKRDASTQEREPMNSQAYYAILRTKREDLAIRYPSGFCLVVSVFNSQKQSAPGNLCEVSIADAARLLYEGTHREATEDEVAIYAEKQDAERMRNAPDNVGRMRAQLNQLLGTPAKPGK